MCCLAISYSFLFDSTSWIIKSVSSKTLPSAAAFFFASMSAFLAISFVVASGAIERV